MTGQKKMCYVKIRVWCSFEKKIATKVDFYPFGFYTLGKIERLLEFIF